MKFVVISFLYLKKYAWIGILLVLIIVFAVSFNEWNKNKEKINNQLNGDELSVVLDKFLWIKITTIIFHILNKKSQVA